MGYQKVRGVEFNRYYYHISLKNIEHLNIKSINLYHMDVEKFDLTDEQIFYFFDPFGPSKMKTVMNKISVSIKNNPREHLIIINDNISRPDVLGFGVILQGERSFQGCTFYIYKIKMD
jgi:hypothetical protein